MSYGKDATELVVASNGSINVGPTDAPLPADVNDVLDSDFVDLGYATEDGVALSVSPNIAEFRAWQARSPVRRELTAQDLQTSFGLEQWNKNSVELAFGGGEVTTVSPGQYRYDFPAEGDALDERSLVVDWQDGGKNYRIVIPRGNVTESVETNLVRAQLSVLPITFKALEPADGGLAYILSDDPAFGTGS